MTNKPMVSALVLLILVAMYMRSKTQEEYEFQDEVELEDVGMAPLGLFGLFKWGKKKKNVVKVANEVDSKSGAETLVPPPAAYREGKEAEAAAAAVAAAEEGFILTETVDIAKIKPFQQSNSQSGRQITAVASPVSGGEVRKPVSVATAISDASGGKIQSAGGTQTADAFVVPSVISTLDSVPIIDDLASEPPKKVFSISKPKIVSSEAALAPPMVVDAMVDPMVPKLVSSETAFAPKKLPKIVSSEVAPKLVSDPMGPTPQRRIVTADKVISDFEGMRKQSKLQVIATLLGL